MAEHSEQIDKESTSHAAFLEGLKETIKRMDSEIKDRDERVQELETKITNLSQEKENLENDKGEQTTHIDALTADLERLTQEKEEVENVKNLKAAQAEKLMATNRQLSQEKEDLINASADLKQHFQRESKIQEEHINKLEEEIERNAEEKETLEREVANRSRQHDEVLTKIRKLERERDDKAAEVEKLKRKLAQLKLEQKELMKLLVGEKHEGKAASSPGPDQEEICQKLSALEKKIEDKEEEERTKRSEQDRLTAEIHRMKSNEIEQRAMFERLNSEIEELKKSNEKHERELRKEKETHHENEVLQVLIQMLQENVSGQYHIYDSKVLNTIKGMFVHFVHPDNVLIHFHAYNLQVLTEPDIERVSAVTDQYGKTRGAAELLSRLCRYKDWFVCLKQVLRDPAVKLGHVADMMEAELAKKNIDKDGNHGSEVQLPQNQPEPSGNDEESEAVATDVKTSHPATDKNSARDVADCAPGGRDVVDSAPGACGVAENADNSCNRKATEMSEKRQRKKALDAAYSDRCNHQMEFSDFEDGGLDQKWLECRHSERHELFIRVQDFNKDLLPESMQDDIAVHFVRAWADLVVGLTVTLTSKKRPKDFPLHEHNGQRNLKRFGSGMVWDVSRKFSEENDSVCPCHECQNLPLESRKKQWGEFVVVTASHLVYDDEESVHTKCKLFYDDDSGVSSCPVLVGVRVVVKDVKRDHQQMLCVTHDSAVSEKLEKMVDTFKEVHGKIRGNLYVKKRQPSSQAKVDASSSQVKAAAPPVGTNVCIIISHPHALSKRISVGEKTREDKSYPYACEYNTSTCPGSSGAPVCILAKKRGRFELSFSTHKGSKITGKYESTGLVV